VLTTTWSRAGTSKQPIYFANWSGRLFVRLLGRTARRHDWTVLAYCLMGNHYHLVLRISEADFSDGLCDWDATVRDTAGAWHRFYAPKLAADDFEDFVSLAFHQLFGARFEV
jgi:hypothetical protein